jgi:hypothetical protein
MELARNQLKGARAKLALLKRKRGDEIPLKPETIAKLRDAKDVVWKTEAKIVSIAPERPTKRLDAGRNIFDFGGRPAEIVTPQGRSFARINPGFGKISPRMRRTYANAGASITVDGVVYRDAAEAGGEIRVDDRWVIASSGTLTVNGE